MPNTLAAPETGIAAPTSTAAERQAALNRRRAELKERQARNIEAITDATLNGASTVELDAERRTLSDSLENLELAAARLRAEVLREERQQLVDELDAALARRGELNEQIAVQIKVVERAQAALDDAVKVVESLKATSSGQFSAAQRLSRHRAAHPDIEEA